MELGNDNTMEGDIMTLALPSFDTLRPEQARQLLGITESFMAGVAGVPQQALYKLRARGEDGRALHPQQRELVEQLAPYYDALPRFCRALRASSDAALAPDDRRRLTEMWNHLAADRDAVGCTGPLALFLALEEGRDWVSTEMVAPIAALNRRFGRSLQAADWVRRLTRCHARADREPLFSAFSEWKIRRRTQPLRVTDTVSSGRRLGQIPPGRYSHASVALVSPMLIGRYPRGFPENEVGPGKLDFSELGLEPRDLGPPAGVWDAHAHEEYKAFRAKTAAERRSRTGRPPSTTKPLRVPDWWAIPDPRVDFLR